MMFPWTRSQALLLALVVVGVAGCSSSLKKVTNPNAPTMEQMYNEYTNGSPEDLAARKAELLQRPAVTPSDVQLGLPPYPERLDHLYPRLPNPDLFMYVRPHAVGESGAPIPAYITRFTMYERQPYALPGETLQSLRVMTDFRVKQLQEKATSKEKQDKTGGEK